MSKNFTSLGFMSGTSADGVDASVILSNGTDFCEILKEKYYEYDKDLFNQIIEIREQINSSKDLRKYKKAINNLENSITLFHAKIFKDIANETKVELIGFHGHTIYHNISEKISVQLGNGKLLSQLTKRDVVYNFRENDINNNGAGAPLAPIYHNLIIDMKKLKKPVCILNIGGISNITLVDDNKLISKDIGPGNCLIDKWIRENTGKKFDVDALISRRGKVNQVVLEQALEFYEHHMEKNLNKSMDIKDFDNSFIRGLSIEDGAATLTEYTARIISSSIQSLAASSNINNFKILVCGGGRKNDYLIEEIKKSSPKNFIYELIDKQEINGDFIESQAFAYLAIRSLLKLPISFPSTTGCKKNCLGGVLIKS